MGGKLTLVFPFFHAEAERERHKSHSAEDPQHWQENDQEAGAQA
jgi:hypothetical protein